MAEEQEQSSSSGNPPNSEDRLRDLGMQLKQHIEYKEWDALEKLLAIPNVWVIDRNMTVGEAIGTMRALLGSAADIQLTLDRVTRTNITDDEANVSLVARLLWSEGETWSEHEEAVEMHLGFRRSGDDWAFSSLGFTPANAAQPEPAPAPAASEVRADFAPDEKYLGAFFDIFRWIFTRSPWSTYLGWGGAVPISGFPPAYFAGEPRAEAVPQAPPASTTHAIVYMPVFVPADIIGQYTPK